MDRQEDLHWALLDVEISFNSGSSHNNLPPATASLVFAPPAAQILKQDSDSLYIILSTLKTWILFVLAGILTDTLASFFWLLCVTITLAVCFHLNCMFNSKTKINSMKGGSSLVSAVLGLQWFAGHGILSAAKR